MGVSIEGMRLDLHCVLSNKYLHCVVSNVFTLVVSIEGWRFNVFTLVYLMYLKLLYLHSVQCIYTGCIYRGLGVASKKLIVCQGSHLGGKKSLNSQLNIINKIVK